MNEIDDQEFVNQLRATYQSYPPHDVDIAAVVGGSVRLKKRRSAGVVLAAAAAVAASVLVGAVALNGSGGAETPPAVTSESTAAPSSALEVEQALYRVFDSRGIGDFYYLTVDASSQVATFWGDPAAPVVGALKLAVTGTGYRLAARAIAPADTWSTSDEEALSAAADETRTLLEQHPGSGLATLRIEVPIKRLVVWRTTPDEQVDASIEQIARDHHVILLLRTAPTSQAEADQIRVDLRADPAMAGRGFEVLGATATPSGVVLTVRGDLDQARESLKDRSDIFWVEQNAATID